LIISGTISQTAVGFLSTMAGLQRVFIAASIAAAKRDWSGDYSTIDRVTLPFSFTRIFTQASPSTFFSRASSG
jgi:hypothetical protein